MPTLFPWPREARATIVAYAWVGVVRRRRRKILLPHLPYLPYRAVRGFAADLSGPGRTVRWQRLAINHWQVIVESATGVEVYP